ncbi:MAG: beta strand repeat-containing protein [Chitinophagales bacterium]
MFKSPTATKLIYSMTVFFLCSFSLYNELSAQVAIFSADTKTGSAATVHSLTGVPVGALLVLTTGAASATQNCTVSSSPSLTWTKRIDATAASSGDAEIYTAIFSAGGTISVTSNWGNQQQGSVCFVVTGQETTLAGATASGTAQSLPSVAITTTRANSILFCATSDWHGVDGGSRVYRNTPITERQYYPIAGTVTLYHYTKSMPTASATTMGLTVPNMNSGGGTAVLEIRSSATDAVSPTVSITSPSAGNVSGTINVNATASDNVGVVGVQFLLDGVNLGTEDLTSAYSVSWNTTTATNGTHTLTARARDAAGNTTTSAGVVVTVNNADTQAPTVSITAPAAGNVSGTINVDANASDNVGVVGVQFLLDGANLGTEDLTSAYSTSWNTTTATNGTHTLTARARDAAGNTTTSAGVVVTVNNPAWSLTGNSGTNPPTQFLGTTDNQRLVIKTNNIEWVTIDPTGKTGIGVTSPTARLDVLMGSTSQPALKLKSIASQTANTFELQDASGNAIVKMRSPDGTTYGQATVSIDAGNKTNNPALSISNIGNGNAGLALVGAGGGGVELISFDLGYPVTWRHTNKHVKWLVDNNSFDNSPESYAFTHLTQPAGTVLMTLQGQAGQTGDMLRIKNGGGTDLFRVTSTGGGYYSADITVNSLTIGRGSGTTTYNTALGYLALASNTTGITNTAVGDRVLGINTTGSNNTGVGTNALLYNTAGSGNAALGHRSLESNTTGNYNTGIGYNALPSNTTGAMNTAVGRNALANNSTADANTAVGDIALGANQTGGGNTAIGFWTQVNNLSGNSNTTGGANTLSNNVTGNSNTAFGTNALYYNTNSSNTALGASALYNNITGANNTAIGINAGLGLTSGSNNLFIGSGALPNISNTSSHQLNIGNWIYGINGDIGIGVSSPTARFHTNGSVRLQGLSNNDALTQILATDALGNLSWRNANTLGSGSGQNNSVTYVTGDYTIQVGDKNLMLKVNGAQITFPDPSLYTGRVIRITHDTFHGSVYDFGRCSFVGSYVPVFNAANDPLYTQAMYTTAEYVSDGAYWQRSSHSNYFYPSNISPDPVSEGLVVWSNAVSYSDNGDISNIAIKGLKAGSGVSLSSDNYDITISATGGGGNWTLSGNALYNNNTSGVVLIGRTTIPDIGAPDAADLRLAVDGIIYTKKVKVSQSNWADYVFQPEYKLLSLEEVEDFIQKNKHLPGVQPAAEIEKQGLDLGDNQATLLKKIEELTLYLIEINKKVDKLTKENEMLKKKVENK